ncbi:ABC transporter substrate-binding protein [Streptomyces sp. NPDC020965]|uniref:ABC transporter substrate-binding protein n=1 Tax=Streptomyces sp. NPDC020965 TaxID=3365105 RepID=UPI0037A512A5
MTGRRRSSSPRPSWIAQNPSGDARTARITEAAGKPRTTRGTSWTAPARPAALLVAGALLATGCGVLPGGGNGSRESVTVMTFAPEKTQATNLPGMPAMAKAYARWVNSDGGIDGHRLRIISCNEKNTAIGASACARRAVAEKVDAVVGSYSQHGHSFMAPLEAAGIPFIGGYGITEEEFTSYLSYPVNGGQSALLAGHGMQLADLCRHVSLVRPDSLAGDGQLELLNAGLARSGRESTDILAPEDATDYTRAAARARSKAGDPGAEADDSRPGCVTATLGERTETFFDSFRRLPDDDLSIRVSSVHGSVGQSLIDRTGGRSGAFEGAFITGWYPAGGDARWDAMREVINTHAFADNSVDPTDPGAQTTWIAYGVLRAVIEEIDSAEITPQRIAHTLDSGVRVDTGGLTPPLRWDFEDMLGTPGLPRVVNPGVTFQVVSQGRLVAQREGFVDVGKALNAAVDL